MDQEPTILGTIRVGDADRERYLVHLAKMRGEDRISAEEHTARAAAMTKALTEKELQRLVSDLPAMQLTRLDRKAAARQRKLEEHRRWWAARGWVGWRYGVTGTIILAFLVPNFWFTIPMTLDHTGQWGPHHPWPLWRDLLLGGSIAMGFALCFQIAAACVWLHDVQRGMKKPWQ